MLFEIAVGDAYGAGFEFSNRQKIHESNSLAAYVAHDLGIAAGNYTDDTQMSIAVSEVLLSGADWSGPAFADAFVRCYRRDSRPGYAKGLQALLAECEDGRALRARMKPESRRNGAAMRSVPLGLIPDKMLLLTTARAQAAVTHDTNEGILSSQVVALMAHFVLYENVEISRLPDAVRRETGFGLRPDWAAEVACDALETLHAVNTALLRNRKLSTLLLDCVNFGGDVDSVAAIALGIASLSSEYEPDVPRALVEGLEQGAYGRSFLIRTDAALAERFPVLAGCLRRTNLS